MDVKVVKGSKNVEVVHVLGDKAKTANVRSMHRTDSDGNMIVAKISNAVIEKSGGLEKMIKQATRINPKLKITVEDAPAS